MITRLSIFTIVVRDQQEALKFYTEKFGFEKRQDNEFWGGRRWITVAPQGQKELEILLEPVDWLDGADRAKAEAVMGNQPSGVLVTDDCRKTYADLVAKGVNGIFPPREEGWGVEARVADLYGNQFSLVERK